MSEHLALIRARASSASVNYQHCATHGGWSISGLGDTIDRDVPALLAAVDAVLGLHDFTHDGGRHDWCLHCGNAWPCPTVRAITKALTSEATR